MISFVTAGVRVVFWICVMVAISVPRFEGPKERYLIRQRWEG